MKIIEILREAGIERCAECRCAVGDDWEYKDFSNKTIIICPQCKTEISIEEMGKEEGLTKEEKEYIIYFIEKHRPNEHIAFRVVNKLKESLQ